MIGAIAIVGVLAAAEAAWAASPGPAIEVLCFNIRFDTAADGDDAWPRRREFVLDTIAEGGPDFIGLQEALPAQRAWIARSLAARREASVPHYGEIARSREASPLEGEATPLLHREDRWERVDGGTFWLSQTPELPGSRDWNAACPRIATWGRFRRREASEAPTSPLPQGSRESRRDVLVVNTHFDHASAEARREGAKVLVAFLSRMRKDHPAIAVIVMGDLNAAPSDAAVATLLAAGLVDTHAAAGGDESLGTYHGFRGVAAAASRPRIDFILASGGLETLAASIDRRERAGRSPSDHFPVRATLRLLAASP